MVNNSQLVAFPKLKLCDPATQLILEFVVLNDLLVKYFALRVVAELLLVCCGHCEVDEVVNRRRTDLPDVLLACADAV